MGCGRCAGSDNKRIITRRRNLFQLMLSNHFIRYSEHKLVIVSLRSASGLTKSRATLPRMRRQGAKRTASVGSRQPAVVAESNPAQPVGRFSDWQPQRSNFLPAVRKAAGGRVVPHGCLPGVRLAAYGSALGQPERNPYAITRPRHHQQPVPRQNHICGKITPTSRPGASRATAPP